MGPRTLPIRIAPTPGESLESWLAALARRLNATWGDLLTALEPSTTPGCLRRKNLSASLSAEEATALAAATGVPEEVLMHLTLLRYRGLLTVDRSTHGARISWASTRSRFCPQCLLESGGRWHLAWRLPWEFACQDHSCTLADACPTCGQFQRVSPWWFTTTEVPDTQRCRGRIEEDGGSRRCDGDLRQAPTVPLPAEHPLAIAGARLSEVLALSEVNFGVYKYAPATTLQVLDDVRIVAARMLTAVHTAHLHELVDRHNWQVIRDGPAILAAESRSWTTPSGFVATAPALVTGRGIALALSVISCSTLDEAADLLRPIIEIGRNSGREVTPSTLKAGRFSAAMEAVQVKAFAKSFGPLDQLRYRSTTPLPRYPRRPLETGLRNTPTCLWTPWSFRFVVGRFRAEAISPALAAMLLIAGSSITDEAAGRYLRSPKTGRILSRISTGLSRHPLWFNMATSLVRLADYLEKNPSPIDYQRRRELDYRDLLPNRQWNEIFDREDFGSLKRDRAGALLRSWLFQKISMQPAGMAPFGVDIPRSERRRAEVVARLNPRLAQELESVAAQFLARQGINGEPVAWAPPLSIVADLDLPGPDPSAVSIQELHQALSGPTVSLASAARNLQVPTALLRYLLECSPRERPTFRRQTQFELAKTQLSKTELVRLYGQDRLSLKTIATRIDVEPKAISELADLYGIEVRRQEPPPPVDKEWMHREYVTNHRTVTDMAQEIGVDIATMSRRLRKNGIAVHRDPRKRPPHTGTLQPSYICEPPDQ